MSHSLGAAVGEQPLLPAATWLLAHRAGNDLDGLRAAEATGADLVEADVHLSRGRLEIRHLKRLGPFGLHWDRWYLTRPAGPFLRLEELLRALAPSSGLMLDLKGVDRRLPTAVARALAAGAAGREVLVCSRTWSLVDRLPRTGLRRIYSAASRAELALLPRRLARTDADGASVHARLLAGGAARGLAGDAGRLLTWAVPDMAAVHELALAGVNGFILDDLALLRDAAGTRGVAA